MPTYGASGITKIDGFIWKDEQWVHSFVTNYTYDAKANLLSEIKTMKDGDYIGQKNIYTYDDQNNFLSEEFYISNSSTQLIGLSKHLYQYNSDWTIKNVTVSAWDAKSAVWIEEALYKYEYDANQNQTLEEISVKTINSPKWEKHSRIEKTFTPSNSIQEESIYKGENGSWIKVSKTVNELNSDNALEKIAIYKNNGQNQWIKMNKYLYEYTNKKLDSISEYFWNGLDWIAHSRDIYTYTNNELVSVKSNLLKSNGESTTYFEKILGNSAGTTSTEYFSFDLKGKKSGIKKHLFISENRSTLDENFIWENETWISQQKTITNYTDNSQIGSVEKHNQKGGYAKIEYQYTNDNRIFTENTFDWYNGEWAIGRVVQYFYTDTVTGIDEPKSNQDIKIWADRDEIKIESELVIKNVKIYTVSGKLIHSGSDIQINTSGWAKAPYIVSVTTHSGKHKATKVLVK